ncbi:hypothetical protein [Paraflavitalea speifideaquila]|uniref:hypothetical protein n=1 Tax=Paraflavitalea speifideaquila TaxID=3076558 RepID=UPI0028EA6109|nr:hypothetical protein [Paraflavitalea speifideiaquila]
MKKLKIMLMSLALFAIVGGALAFKAKFVTDFCTTTPGIAGNCPSGLKCPNLRIDQAITDQGGVGPFCTAIPPNGCNPNTPCSNANPVRLTAN